MYRSINFEKIQCMSPSCQPKCRVQEPLLHLTCSIFRVIDLVFYLYEFFCQEHILITIEGLSSFRGERQTEEVQSGKAAITLS